ncbi:hypothetical protein BpHYR1_021043 [Brachionus plicatilis]|uniref:Uncharacterized protein n=1 Tax=Brachionus plicatilis TaxID=10195 RepID=A0A3M7QZ76_BRAPC|nr:hypothetical protein BpHYR1_021043 [Brachionus plicatilis]
MSDANQFTKPVPSSNRFTKPIPTSNRFSKPVSSSNRFHKPVPSSNRFPTPIHKNLSVCSQIVFRVCPFKVTTKRITMTPQFNLGSGFGSAEKSTQLTENSRSN